nr:amidohydrolase family protein [Limobrevibacterium gyesilva]
MHVFGAPDRYPPAATRAYTPTEAPLARYRALATALGLQRVVLVQPSAYGTDNACMLDALRTLPGATRGVAVIDDATPEAALDEMQRLGVRGIRLNLVSNGIPDAAEATAALRAAAARVAPRGWHVQIFVPPTLLQALVPAIRALPVPVVIDHMGGADARLGASQPGLDELVALLAEGGCWVKVSGANRVSRQPAGFADARPIMRALIAANPERVVWGTDWPHIGPHDVGAPKTVIYMPHDNAGLLRLLGEAAPDAQLRRRILVDNPQRLYGFDA